MILSIERFEFSDKSTIGRLRINGEFECYTLEDTVRDPGVKIAGETAIPYGRYTVVITRSNRFKRDLPLLLDVQNFTGVRIHAGNTAEDTEGCILVGKTHSPDKVSQSVVAMNDLFGRMLRAKANQEHITLDITSCKP